MEKIIQLKKILGFIVIIIILLIGCGQKEKKISISDLTSENVYGKVKSIKQTTFKAVRKFDETIKGEEIPNSLELYLQGGGSSFTEYNISGNILTRDLAQEITDVNFAISSMPNNTITTKYAYRYNKNNKLIESKHYLSNGKLNLRHTYIYDDNGRLVEENNYHGNGQLQLKTTMKFD